MTATSYANLSFCCTCLPQKTRHHNLKNTSRHINLSRNRAFEDPHTKKGKEGKNSKVVSNSGRVAICVSTAGYDAVRSHRENVFETPILISSHSGSRTTAEKRQKENGKGQFKATSSHCSRQTTRKKEMISCWGSKVYFPFHFLGNVKWLSIQPTGNNIGPIDYFAIETKFFAGSAFSCEISIWFWK